MKKEELKKILNPIVKEICSQMAHELSYDERQLLGMEIATSIISSTINYNQPFNKFSTELASILSTLVIEGGKQITESKAKYDFGEKPGEVLYED